MKDETRDYLIEEMGRVHEVFQTLDRYDPDLVDSLASLRRNAIPGLKDTGACTACKVSRVDHGRGRGGHWER